MANPHASPNPDSDSLLRTRHSGFTRVGLLLSLTGGVAMLAIAFRYAVML